MTELSGTLDGVGLPAIVRFLSGLKKTGCLSIVQNNWQGDISFEAGQLTSASFAARTGLAALDALVQVLPEASFAFDTSARASRPATVALSADALQAHFDDLAAGLANGASRLPSIHAVPTLVVTPEPGDGEVPVALDRGTLQTLLAVDGERTAREIVARRGSFDALWQLGTLAEVGVVRLGPARGARPAQGAAATALPVDAAMQATAPRPAEAPVARAPDVSHGASRAESVAASGHCPKLGFEDDPRSVFGRPTRLHRCFAANTPLPLSLEQQRELCLSDQFGTCPRLSTVSSGAITPPVVGIHGVPPATTGARDKSAREQPAGIDPRIVQLPTAGRNTFWSRRASQPEPSPEPLRRDEAASPTPLRAHMDRARNAASTTNPAPAADDRTSPAPDDVRPAVVGKPGSSLDRDPRSSPDGEPDGSSVREPHSLLRREPRSPLDQALEREPRSPVDQEDRSPPYREPRLPLDREPRSRRAASRGQPPASPPLSRFASLPVLGRWAALPVPLLAGVSLLVIVLAVAVYALAPQLSSLFLDDSADLSGLPNASAVAAGTPVTQVTARRTSVSTPGATSPSSAAAPAVAGPPALAAAAVTSPPAAAAGPPALAASAPAVAAPAAAPPAPASNTVQPDPRPATPAAAAVLDQAPPASGAPPLFDDTFATNAHNWPSDPQGTASVTGGAYRLVTRRAGQFVAIGAPIAAVPQDVSVSATFRKLDGTPPGGGFGIILRDQATSSRDGTSQAGQYYVLEVGDTGEVGIWRRDMDHWVDLLAWQHADAVRTGSAPNQMTVTAIGPRLSLSVNGTQVVTRTDATFTAGGVGILVGGDGNQVAVERFTVQTP